MSAPPAVSPWYTRIGPGLITACVVIGPGSILTSSQVGANNGYAMLWIIVVSVVFMLTYMTLGATLGVATQESPGDLLRRKAGAWLAILIGGAVFFISAAYQAGNNIGVAAAFESFVPQQPVLFGREFHPSHVIALLVVLLNAIAILFLFAFRDLYKMVERLMMLFVGLMLISFAINLVTLGPDLSSLLRGFIPSPGRSTISLELLGLIGTTFVITAAFYQSYLVKQKGWTTLDLKSGLVDARIGSIIMALITVMLMSTAAAGLYTGETIELKSVVEVATALEPTFGQQGRVIFCLGLFSAAYSSFLVNSMIGGFVAADGLGWGSRPTDLAPRILTTLALLTGMVIGLAVLVSGWDRTPSIIGAQAVTVVAAPLVAGVLLWLASSRDVMGEHVSRPVLRGLGVIGLILLIAMSGRTALVELPKTIEKYRQSRLQTEQWTPPSNGMGTDLLVHGPLTGGAP